MEAMVKRLCKSLLSIITKQLLASVNFLNYQESVEARLSAIEERLASTEVGVDNRLDKLEDRLNKNEIRRNLIERTQDIHRGLFQTFYGSSVSNQDITNFTLSVKNILSPSIQIDNKCARFGNIGDGGYVIVDDLKKSDVLFSIGIGDNVSFDKQSEPKVSKVILIDHTVPWFLPPQGNFEIIRKPLQPEEASTEGVTIKELLDSNSTSGDYILKLDIEGDEWKVLNDLDAEDFLKFRQIIVEFHGLNEFEDLENKISALHKLASTHVPIAVHPNNHGTYLVIGKTVIPDVIEVTWARLNSYTFNSGNYFKNGHLFSANSPDLPDIQVEWINGNS